MRRLHLRRVGVAALLVLALAGCGDETGDNPAPSDAATTSSSDVAPTTADATTTDAPSGGDGEPSSGDAEPTTEAVVTDAATQTTVPTTDDPSVTDETAAPIQTEAPPPDTPPHGECSGDSLSNDILGFTGGVSVDFCEDGWAFATYPGAPDTPEFVAEVSDGRWFHAVTLGDPVCPSDLIARGAPDSIAEVLPPCDAAPPPTTDPPAPTDPGAPCTISTALYGSTSAELVGVSCGEATAEWQVAEANGEASWTIPVTTPSGWECYITPYDETSAAAGSCYGPDGSAFFTLYP
ncbi:hypothetical protein [Ornithinimicrobium faecis]|uniref:Uncharacterized protein n=1 Tax=Ornithinimicrobium faecis TaxID=2934158 RepID=A0ABY4YYD3_9MICO|nr:MULTISPECIES: hypothetical protein [unclassified Ornithinimicrobium]USQ81751.1 hypothetical protein NF556_08930 [Ornithinimicrobium sp. HY1793]